MNRETVKDFARELYAIFLKQRPTQLAAALAFYGLFSIAPLLFIIRTIFRVFIGVDINGEVLSTRVEAVLGPQAVPILQKAVDQVASRAASGSSWIVTVISLGVILFAAIGLFFEVQYSLNRIWDVPLLAYKSPKAYLQQQLLYFVMVIGLGFLLVLATAINLIISWLDVHIQLENYLPVINVLALLGLIILAFGTVYKVLPNTTIAWRDVWLGACLASVLIVLGGVIFSIYIQASHVGATFGAAGALIIILIGMNYFAQIFLFGAMFTRVYALKFGSMQHSSSMVYSEKTAHSS